jgi:hypothetical protein
MTYCWVVFCFQFGIPGIILNSALLHAVSIITNLYDKLKKMLCRRRGGVRMDVVLQKTYDGSDNLEISH